MRVQGIITPHSCSLALAIECKTQRQHPHTHRHISHSQSHFRFPFRLRSSPLQSTSICRFKLIFVLWTAAAAAEAASAAASHYFLICFSRFAFAWFFALFVFFFLLLFASFCALHSRNSRRLRAFAFCFLLALSLTLSVVRLPRKPLSALSCLIVWACVSEYVRLFRQFSTLAFASWDLCTFSNWRGQQAKQCARVCFFLLVLLMFSLVVP